MFLLNSITACGSVRSYASRTGLSKHIAHSPAEPLHPGLLGPGELGSVASCGACHRIWRPRALLDMAFGSWRASKECANTALFALQLIALPLPQEAGG